MRKELKIGIFAVVVLVVSFFVLNYLRGKDIFNREIEVTARFENVDGLVASAPVYIKGFKAGVVAEVLPDTQKGDFVVTCSISKDFSIPVDSRMVIYSTDVMGGKGVKVEYGSSEEFVADGGSINSGLEIGLMDGIGDTVIPLVNKVTSTLDSLNLAISGVNDVLSQENISALSNSIADIEHAVSDVRGFTSTINGKSGQISDFIDSLTEFSDNLEAIVAKVDTTVTGVNGFVDTLNTSDIEGLVVSFKSLLENINNPEGTVGKLLEKDSVYNSVDSLLINMNSLIEKIEQNPKKYLKISVF